MVAVVGSALVGIGTAVLGQTAATAAGVVATGIIGGVVAAGTVAAVGGTIQANKAQKAAAQAQQRASNLQAKRNRRQAIRANILASARARASAQNAGTATSSGLSGAVGAGRSQLGAEFGFGTQMSGLSAEIANFQGQAQRASNIASLGMKAVGFGLSQGGQKTIENVGQYVDSKLA